MQSELFAAFLLNFLYQHEDNQTHLSNPRFQITKIKVDHAHPQFPIELHDTKVPNYILEVTPVTTQQHNDLLLTACIGHKLSQILGETS